MSASVLFLVSFVFLPALIIWLAKRDRLRSRIWGEQRTQNSILIGAELDMPSALPVEQVTGLTVNGAPVDDVSHMQKLAAEDGIAQ